MGSTNVERIGRLEAGMDTLMDGMQTLLRERQATPTETPTVYSAEEDTDVKRIDPPSQPSRTQRIQHVEPGRSSQPKLMLSGQAVTLIPTAFRSGKGWMTDGVQTVNGHWIMVKMGRSTR